MLSVCLSCCLLFVVVACWMVLSGVDVCCVRLRIVVACCCSLLLFMYRCCCLLVLLPEYAACCCLGYGVVCGVGLLFVVVVV